jgi:hypothetical protein
VAKLNLASPRVDSRVRPSPSNRDLCRRTFYIDRTPLETPTSENILYTVQCTYMAMYFVQHAQFVNLCSNGSKTHMKDYWVCMWN